MSIICRKVSTGKKNYMQNYYFLFAQNTKNSEKGKHCAGEVRSQKMLPFKGTVHSQDQKYIFVLLPIPKAIYPSKLFWCELPSFGDSGNRDFCLFSNIMEVNGALIVVLTAPKY